MPDPEIPVDVLSKLSTALTLVSRGDPVVSLRNELKIQFDAIDTRFGGIDTATALQHQDMVRVPTQVDRAVEALGDLLKAEMNGAFAKVDGKLSEHIAQTNERFIAVRDKFADIAKFTAEKAGDTKLAVDAAFMAAKAETAKIEAGLTKLIDGQGNTIDTKTTNLDGRINDLKEQMTTMVGRASVADPHLAQSLSSLGSALGALQDTTTRAITKMGDANADAIRELAKSLRSVERSEAGTKERGMGRGEIISYIMMGILVLSQAATIFVVLPRLHP